MATATTSETSSEFDPFQYFEGGKQGIQKRYGEMFLKEFDKISLRDYMNLCDAVKINPQETYRRLVQKDYSFITGTLIENFSTPFRINSYAGFGKPNINPDERRKLVGILGTTDEAHGNLVLMVKALQQLDSD